MYDAVMELIAGPAAQAGRVKYLEEELFQFQAKEGGRTWSIYGTPWVPFYSGTGFNYRPEEAAGG